jgi:hypothetical protein
MVFVSGGFVLVQVQGPVQVQEKKLFICRGRLGCTGQNQKHNRVESPNGFLNCQPTLSSEGGPKLPWVVPPNALFNCQPQKVVIENLCVIGSGFEFVDDLLWLIEITRFFIFEIRME